MYYIYVLKSEKNGNLYKGFARDLENRILRHNKGYVKSTKNGRPYELVYYEIVKTLKESLEREKYFKSGFGRKYIKNKIKQGPIV